MADPKEVKVTEKPKEPVPSPFEVTGPVDALTRSFLPLVAAEQERAAVMLTVQTPYATAHDSERQKFIQVVSSQAGGNHAELLFDAGIAYGIPPAVLYGIMMQESSGISTQIGFAKPPFGGNRAKWEKEGVVFRADGNAPDGDWWDRGLMQINWYVHNKWFVPGQGVPAPDWRDPRTNIFKGAEILASKLKVLSSAAGLTQLAKIVTGKTAIPPVPTGLDLTIAAVAAYNTGEGNVFRALLAGQSPDQVTHEGKYARQVLGFAARISELLAKAGSLMASSANPYAGLVMAPSDGTAWYINKSGNDRVQAMRRARQMAEATPDSLRAQAEAHHLKKASQVAAEYQQAANAARIAELPRPFFVKDAGLASASYNFRTGLWEDGQPT